MQIKRDEVLRNLAMVCAGYKGTLEDHQYLQAVLKWLNEQLPEENIPELKDIIESQSD